MEDDEIEDYEENLPRYRDRSDIRPNELVEALSSIRLLNDDPYLRMQVHNLSIVDQFIMELEEQVRDKLFQEERTPMETMFLSAQSQMWIFAIYEILITWRQITRQLLNLHKHAPFKTNLK